MSDEIKQSPALFEQTGSLATNDAGAVARAVQEVQAALVIAQRFPRDEIKAKAKILKACERPELAEVAEYEYTRGNTKITGPTIDLLRAIANRWGNLRFGWAEVDRQNGQSSIRTFAWDMQTNGQTERTFTVKHWRDTREGGYLLKDERDIYELLANSAARRVRACLEEVIDADIVTAAVDQCRRTLVQGAGKVPLRDQCVQMLNAFVEFGVTQDMIEKRLGNKLDAVSPNQLASLRRVFKSLKDGIGQREDYFKPELAKPEFGGGAENTSGQLSTAGMSKDARRDPGASKGAETAPPSPDPDDNVPMQYPPAAAIPALGEEQRLKDLRALAEEVNPLKTLRGLCANAKPKVKEGKLLEYLGASGASDGSVGSLDELYMANSEVVKALAKAWPDVLAKFREWEGQ